MREHDDSELFALASDGWYVGVAHGHYARYRALGEIAPGKVVLGFLKGRLLGSMPASMFSPEDWRELRTGGFVRRDQEIRERTVEDAAASARHYRGEG